MSLPPSSHPEEDTGIVETGRRSEGRETYPNSWTKKPVHDSPFSSPLVLEVSKVTAGQMVLTGRPLPRGNPKDSGLGGVGATACWKLHQ